MFTKKEKDYLLKIARQAIESAVGQKEPPQIIDCPENLMQKSGAFITLHKFGDLRGCIGMIESAKSLVETVIETAPKSALEDPRFMPATQDELEDLEIEISVLSPLKEIKDINEIEVGTHGILMEKDFYRGLLLPQVATEYNWDRETFLNQTARKSGLPVNAWKKGDIKIYIFTADIFSESEIN